MAPPATRRNGDGIAMLGTDLDCPGPIATLAKWARQPPRTFDIKRRAATGETSRPGRRLATVRKQMPASGDDSQLDVAPKANRSFGGDRGAPAAPAPIRGYAPRLGRDRRFANHRRFAGAVARDLAARRLGFRPDDRLDRQSGDSVATLRDDKHSSGLRGAQAPETGL